MYKIIKKHEPTNLMIVTNGEKFTVVQWNQEQGQMYAPIYRTKIGECYGAFCKGWSEGAVDYVANWCSKSTAYKRFKEEIKPYEEHQELIKEATN